MVQLSKFNNTYNALNASASFVGQLESTADLVSISVNVHCEQACRVIIKQYRSRDLTTQVQENAEDVAADTRQVVQTPIKAAFYDIEVVNLAVVDMSFTRVTTYLQSTHYVNLDIRKLTSDTDTVVSYGQNSNFDFYPTVDNNTIQIYADGAKGTNVTGGWQYTNTAVNKINWYLYQAPTSGGNPTTAGQTVSSVKSMYAVINQQSTLGLAQAQNPWIMIYTIPDSGVNASFYKSKLFYGSNAHTDISGNKLLYTGTDPADVHPEITGINRIKLDFNLSLSTKTEEAAAAELVGAGTLQTTANTTTVGSFNFTMSQFGVEWEKVNTPLPIENGKVVVDTGVVTCMEKSPTGAITNLLGNAGDLVIGVHSTLQSLNLSKIGGGGFAYVKIYNKATVPSSTDTPVFTIPIQNNSIQQVECHSLDFPLGIGLRATLNFDPADTDAPTGTIYGTAFYTNVIN